MIILCSTPPAPPKTPFSPPPHSLCHKPLKMIRPAKKKNLHDKYRLLLGSRLFFSGAGTEIQRLVILVRVRFPPQKRFKKMEKYSKISTLGTKSLEKIFFLFFSFAIVDKLTVLCLARNQ